MRKKTYTKYKQGVYRPTKKYRGHKDPVYRSSWELKFFRWCDNNPNVIQWSSESTIIPYVSPIDNKVHRYFVDNTITIKEGNNLAKYVIEIKPKKQTVKPVAHGNKKKSTVLYENMTYVVNMAKWESAHKWCKKHGYKFQILTEDHLFGK